MTKAQIASDLLSEGDWEFRQYYGWLANLLGKVSCGEELTAVELTTLKNELPKFSLFTKSKVTALLKLL